MLMDHGALVTLSANHKEFEHIAMRQRPQSHDQGAIILVLLGSLIPLLGIAVWAIGVLFLWRSKIFHTRDKLIGSLLLPGGLQAALFYLYQNVNMTCHGSCTAPIVANFTHTVIFAFLVAIPVGVTCWLWWMWKQGQDNSSVDDSLDSRPVTHTS